MKLIILGSGTCILQKKRFSSSCLIELNNQLLLFDCGWGTGVRLLQSGYDIQKLDHIFITHPHADHIGGLINILQSMLVTGYYNPSKKRKKPLFLHGYLGFKKDYETLRNIMFQERVEPYDIHIIEYLDTAREQDSLIIQTKEVPHVPERFHSIAFRIQSGEKRLFKKRQMQGDPQGKQTFPTETHRKCVERGNDAVDAADAAFSTVSDKAFVYSGDCGSNDNLLKLAFHADIAVFEAGVPIKQYKKNGPQKNHLSPGECGKIAESAGVKMLILTHLTDNDRPAQIKKETTKTYSGEIIIAEDLLEIRI